MFQKCDCGLGKLARPVPVGAELIPKKRKQWQSSVTLISSQVTNMKSKSVYLSANFSLQVTMQSDNRNGKRNTI